MYGDQLRRSSRVSSLSSSLKSDYLQSLGLSSEDEDDEDIYGKEQRIRVRTELLWRKIKSAISETVTVKNTVNASFILFVCIICFQQCYLQVSEYLLYKTRVQVSHTFPTSTVFLLPGVTVCNNNRLRLDRLAEEIPQVRDDVSKILNDTVSGTLTDRKRIQLIRSIKQAVDDAVNISKIINESPISTLMKLSRYPMIKDINCNTSWGRQINCENIRIIESFQGVPCYTAFYLGSLLESLSSGRAFNYRMSLLNGQRKLTPFESHEIAEILVNFDPMQHGDFNRDVGGKLVIHSTGHIGSVRDVAHAILPGNRYEIIIQRFMSKRLPPPYETMCFDYKQANSAEFTEGKPASPSTELDKTTCTRNCIIKQATKACNCWPVEVPHYPNDTLIPNSDSYRMCAWGFEEASSTGNFSTRLYVDCYRRFHAECRSKCSHGCRTEDYKVYKMVNPWPGRHKFLLAATSKEKAELTRLRSCCALISIKYVDLMERRNIMIPNLTLAQLVSNIGGIVSALVGVSVVTIYRYVTRRILQCKIISDYRLNGESGGGRPAKGPSRHGGTVAAPLAAGLKVRKRIRHKIKRNQTEPAAQQMQYYEK